MTFMEKAHKEIQFVDLVMIVIASIWMVVATLNFVGVIRADLWFFHFIIGACTLIWAAGFHTRWKRTGIELEAMTRHVCDCYIDGTNAADPSSMYSPHRDD